MMKVQQPIKEPKSIRAILDDITYGYSLEYTIH